MTFKEWFNNKMVTKMSIHQSVASRKKFKRFYLALASAILLVLILGIILLAIYGLRFDENRANSYIVDESKRHGVYFLVIGLILFTLGSIAWVALIALYYPILYKSSRELYLLSDEYKKIVIDFQNKDLTKYSIKELKWFKKLGWIDKMVYQIAISKIKAQTRKKLKTKLSLNKHEEK